MNESQTQKLSQVLHDLPVNEVYIMPKLDDDWNESVYYKKINIVNGIPENLPFNFSDYKGSTNVICDGCSCPFKKMSDHDSESWTVFRWICDSCQLLYVRNYYSLQFYMKGYYE